MLRAHTELPQGLRSPPAEWQCQMAGLPAVLGPSALALASSSASAAAA